MRKILSCLLFIVLTQASVITNAAIPQELNFQSKLNTASGGLFNGQVMLTFVFFHDLGATNLAGWSETHLTVDVVDSVYSVAVGSQTGFPVDLFDQPLFMEISIQPLTKADGTALSVSPAPTETLSPLLPFRSVGYAFFAENIADDAVDSDAINDGSVDTDDIAGDAVTSAKIADGTIVEANMMADTLTAATLAPDSVGSSELANNAVGFGELQAGAVIAGKIASDAVGSSELANDSVGPGELQTGAVNTVDIAADAVTSAKIADGTIVEANMAADTLTAATLAPDSVGFSELADDAVDTASVEDGAITTAKIADSAITAAKINATGLDADLLDTLEAADFLQLATGPQTVTQQPKFNAGIMFSDGSVQTSAGGGGVPTGSEVIVAVDCDNSETVQGALDASLPGGLLTINIVGTCNETVRITRSRVRLNGGGGATIIGQHIEEGAVNAFNVQDVRVDNIDLQSSLPTTGYGVLAIDKGQIRVSNSNISSAQFGAIATREGRIRLENVNITGVANYGLLVVDGGSAEVRDSTIAVDLVLSTYEEYALAMYRGGVIRLRGINTISNMGAGSGERFAMSLYHRSQLRQGNGHTTITGDIEIGNLTNVGLRDVTVVGNINVDSRAILDIRDESIPTTGSPTVTGDINLSHSRLKTGNGVVLGGNVNGWEETSVAFRGGTEVVGDVNVTGGTLSLGDGVTISGRVNLNQATFSGNDNAVLSNEFNASQSEVNFSGAGASYTGNIRVSDYSKVFIDSSLTAISPVECSLSTINLQDGTTINPGGGPEPFSLNKCQFFSGDGSTITGDINARNGSGVEIWNNTEFNGNINLSSSELSLGEVVDFNGNMHAQGSSIRPGGIGTDISGQINLESGSELYIDKSGDPTPASPTFHDQISCSDSQITFDDGVSFGANMTDPNANVIDGFRNCNLRLPPNGTITGRIGVNTGSTIEFADTTQLNGDLEARGSSIIMPAGAGIAGNLRISEHSDLNIFNHGTVGTNAITGEIDITRSSANIANNVTFGPGEFFSVSDHSTLGIGSGTSWSRDQEIYVNNFSHVEVPWDGATATSVTSTGGAYSFALQDNSSLQLGENTTVIGFIGMGPGSTLSANDGVEIDGSISAPMNNSLTFANNNVVTGSITCDGLDSVVAGPVAPMNTSGGAVPTVITNCTNRLP